MEQVGRPEFNSRNGLGFHLATASSPALEPTQPPLQWVPGGRALFLVVKRAGREADHLPASNAETENEWNHTSTPPIRLHGVVLN
jgi:hypothetical protein